MRFLKIQQQMLCSLYVFNNIKEMIQCTLTIFTQCPLDLCDHPIFQNISWHNAETKGTIHCKKFSEFQAFIFVFTLRYISSDFQKRHSMSHLNIFELQYFNLVLKVSWNDFYWYVITYPLRTESEKEKLDCVWKNDNWSTKNSR